MPGLTKMNVNFYNKYIFLCALILGKEMPYNITTLCDVVKNQPNEFDEQCELLSQNDCIILLNVFYYSAYRSYMTLLFNKYIMNIEDKIEYNNNLIMHKMRNPSLMLMQQNEFIEIDEYNTMIENVLFFYNQYSFITDALKYHIFDCSEHVALLFNSVKNQTRLLFPALHSVLFDVVKLVKDIVIQRSQSLTEEFLFNENINKRGFFKEIFTDALYVKSYVNMDTYMRQSFETHYEIKKTLNALRNRFWQLIERQRLRIYLRYYHKLLDFYNTKYDKKALVKIVLNKNPELLVTYHWEEDVLPFSLRHLEIVIEE